jgi:hypothetical protein
MRQRRPITLGELVHIGKVTNLWEEVEQVLVHDWEEVQWVFRERGGALSLPGGDAWDLSATRLGCVECGARLYRVPSSSAYPHVGSARIGSASCVHAMYSRLI